MDTRQSHESGQFGLLPLLAALFLGMVVSSSVSAQRVAGDAERSIRPFLGVALGWGPFPGALQPECRIGYEGRTPGLSADVAGGVSIGAIRLEARNVWVASAVMEACFFIGPSWPSGVHTDRIPAIDRGDFKLTNLRASYVFGAGPGFLMVTGGAGWIWQRDVPVVLLGSGIGVGGRVRLVANFDWLGYRIPWRVVTAEWQNGTIVRELESRSEHDWRSGRNFRFGIEIAPIAVR